MGLHPVHLCGAWRLVWLAPAPLGQPGGAPLAMQLPHSTHLYRLALTPGIHASASSALHASLLCAPAQLGGGGAVWQHKSRGGPRLELH